jgi:integrase/recombinase XerD
MLNALSDFLIYCRIERRLADLTCKAYERDVRACLDFMRAQGISTLIEIRTPDLRRFLAEETPHRPAPSSQARTVAALRCFLAFKRHPTNKASEWVASVVAIRASSARLIC